MSTTVADVMTTRVVAVRTDATFKEMAAILRASRISAFPVIDHAGKVIGVVSEADLLVREAGQAGRPGLVSVLRHRQERRKVVGVTAGDLMTWPAVTISPGEPVEKAARLMFDRRVKRLPVVNGTGCLVGILSRADVLSVFSRADDEIRREVTDKVILGTFVADPQSFAVTVRDGIVTVSGQPETDQAGHDIVAGARHVDGVVAVRDRLSYAGASATGGRSDWRPA